MTDSIQAGYRVLDVEHPGPRAALPVWVLYPTRARAEVVRVGPYELELARDAPVAGDALRLVAISHGNGGSPWTHRGLARHLARAGFVVALFEHLGNSRSDNSLAGTAANLERRPRQLRSVVDAVLGSEDFGERLASARYAVVGHSIGGYTALALAGGRPVSFGHEEENGVERPVEVTVDERIGALVLLAPATVWFRGEAPLGAVRQPILLRTAEHDREAPPALHAEIVLRGVSDPARVDHRVVENAGHFSFQDPFPPAMASASFPPAQDPPGFDRAAHQKTLRSEVEAFLRAELALPSVGGPQ